MDKSNRKTMIVGPKVFVKARPKAIHHRPQKKSIGQKKKEYRCTPTFVNLKSNTMKNTLQRYGLLRYLQTIQEKKYVL